MSLYQDVRPVTFDDIVGNKAAVAALKAALAKDARPHVFLLHGPSGCGKTTLARILARELGCDVRPDGSMSYVEVNGSNARGIDDMRRVVADSAYPPITGGNRVICLDEVQKATNDAQNCLLKPLEDWPPYQYYVLCTTDPAKVIKAVQTRCAIVEVKRLSSDEVFDLLTRTVVGGLAKDPGDDVLSAIADRADGCPRAALTMLEQAAGLSGDDALAAVKGYRSTEEQVIDLVRKAAQGKPWTDLAASYNRLEDKEPETIRRVLLAYLAKCLLGAKTPGDATKYVAMIEELSGHTYDSGEAGLLAKMWNAARVGK